MSSKYTFWELCKSYDKIEIPIIQRDYAQGRNTHDVQILRDKFINEYLIKSILSLESIELDFVYGSILSEDKNDKKQNIFIPLDGQQRLTTLYLLHFFLAVKENRLVEIKDTLSKFTYETRPSAHDFCRFLLEIGEVKSLSGIKSEIEDSVWFNEEWKDDPTVSGMLNMLDTLAKNESLANSEEEILSKLIDRKNNLVTFYFTDLDQFGLTENLYIRMNARGKMLTEFENFKSEFSKIIRYNHGLLETVKDRIEYEWVDNLWDFRDNGSYIIDSPFMAYLSFLTEMLYFKDAEFRAKSYESNFLDFKILKEIYSKESNLRFLIFSYDFISDAKNYNGSILWEGESLHSILKDILSNKRDINQIFIFFLTLIYCFEGKPKNGLNDFIRVVRNLIENTDDKSRREWPRLIASLQNLVSDKNVYALLSEGIDDNKLVGFNVEQRREEVFKAKLVQAFEDYRNLIFAIEDNKNLKGKITNILLTPHIDSEEQFDETILESVIYDTEQLKLLKEVFDGYVEISQKDFNPIWGNLLGTSLYTQTYESRLIFSGSYRRHPAVLLFAKGYAKSNIGLSGYIEQFQKSYILGLVNDYANFSEIRNVKDQLLLYYIISERIYNKPYWEFFKNHNFNFGWLTKEPGYKSLFSNGIYGCRFFEDYNPIFQVYNQQFRFNLGLNQNNTLDIEIIGGNKRRNPFDLIKDWANDNQFKN
ncbi:DUF262 domain-containing protein [Rufibacter psychrotolerans]|uniref:DUF262 domain-containing protein n=1 Tax=Rufibacter psychrotolerans TaxID=2812556 RepID=UPI00196895FA|nr:DUF262 domain-containing protein [Rufibacter sp. SYSU D00308]